MLTSAPRAATIVSLVVALVACGGDGGPYPDDGAQGSSSSGGDGTAGDGTAGDGTGGTGATDTGAADPQLALCVAWCMHRSECDEVDVTLADCELECGPTYAATPERCHGEVDGVFICAAGLDCTMASEFDIGELSGPCGDRIGAYRTCVAG